MKKAKEILTLISTETKSKSNINHYLLARLREEGKEVNEFGTKKEKGLTTENPIKKLFRKGYLNNQEYFAALKYQNAYEQVNISRHSRPIYDGSAVSSAVNKPISRLPFTDSQIAASKFIATARNAVMAKNFFEKNGELKSRLYLEITEMVFEKQKSLRFIRDTLRLQDECSRRKVKEICNILLEIK
jgi:hypothetical protein